MGVLFDYFAASSDQEAAGAIDRLGGPSSQAVAVPQVAPAKRRFRRASAPPQPTFETDASLEVFDTVSDTGVDPVVQLGTLQALLTDQSYDDIVDDPRCGHALENRDGGERLVLTVADSLLDALAESSEDDLSRAAEPWSQTEEFWGMADPEDLSSLLSDLAGLSRRAKSNGQHLYCWVSV